MGGEGAKGIGPARFGLERTGPDRKLFRPGASDREMARAAALLTLLACAAALAFASPAAADDVEDSLFDRINAARVETGLRPLRVAPGLRRAATAHARWMARSGSFTHSSADGSSPDARIRRYYDASLVGETLLWGSPGVTPAETVQRWLASPPHRGVLLDRRFREIGLSVVQVEDAPGAYSGLDVTIVVADLALPD